MRHSKPWEFSKIIVAIGFAIEAFVSIFACIVIWRTLDISGIGYISAINGAVTLSIVSFYFWKAKAENKSKMAKDFVKCIAEKYGIEAAIQVMELIMKE